LREFRRRPGGSIAAGRIEAQGGLAWTIRARILEVPTDGRAIPAAFVVRLPDPVRACNGLPNGHRDRRERRERMEDDDE